MLHKKICHNLHMDTLFSLPYVLPCVTSEYLYFGMSYPHTLWMHKLGTPISMALHMPLKLLLVQKPMCTFSTYMLLFALFMHKHVISIPRYGFQFFVTLVTLPFIFPTMFPHKHVSIIRIPVNKPPLARSAYRFMPLGLT